jgi:hypothetical protein
MVELSIAMFVYQRVVGWINQPRTGGANSLGQLIESNNGPIGTGPNPSTLENVW